ncbi:MAG: GAF domain-containing protein [Salinigranum sp.]
MTDLSARASGGTVGVVGLALLFVHVLDAARVGAVSFVAIVDTAVPFVLAVTTVVAGTLLSQGRLVGESYVQRVLAWTVTGGLALAVATPWLLADAVGSGGPFAAAPAILNAFTLGTLIGLVVGVYDARSREQQAHVGQLNRINNTLRIATQELVNAESRDELERDVCERMTSSDLYDVAWIGRYDPADGQIRPVSWSGLDDPEYFESLVITVDDAPTGQGPGGEAVRTREIQCVHDILEEPAMSPWRGLAVSRGVRSLAAIPIVRGESAYGLIGVYANRPNVFGEAERTVLSELGETLGHAIHAIDTRERLAERERELEHQNARLAEFAGVISHDLRNPLNVAEGFLELARDDHDGDHLRRVDAALTRMDELIEDLLTLARNGELVSERETVSLREVVDDAWSVTTASEADLRIVGDLGTVSCDRSRLRELMENLFRNAVEHAGPGVTVSVGRTEGGFYVEDDGPGIPEDVRERAFEVGYSTSSDGHGFGLNIVRSIAEAHGWTVGIDDGSTDGARFVFSGVDAETAPEVA